jgi:DNA-binding transcriptional LysR family regulator
VAHLDPNDLLLFARVVEEGSFSRAAERLGIPVSTASRRITGLEKRLGERLLQRTTRKLSVTELGLAVAEHARQVLLAAEAADAVANSRHLKPSGLLRVTMASDLGVLAPFVADFLTTYPAITVEIDVSVRIVDLVGENFDVALRVGMGPLKDDASLAARPVLLLQGGLYAAPSYLKKRGAPRDPDALFDHDAVHGLTRSGEALRWSLQRGRVRWEGVPAARVSTNSPEQVLRLAAEGTGIVLAVHGSAEPYVRSGQLTRVLSEWDAPPATLWAVFPGRRLMPAKTRVFLDALKAEFGAVAVQGPQ